MSEEVMNETENILESEQAGQEPANSGGAEQKTFSQADVDRMIKARAEREVKKTLGELGVAGVDELKTLIKQKQERDEAEKTELQKAQERASELEKKLIAAADAQKRVMAQSEITAKAAKLGIVDTDAAYRLLDHDQLEYDESGRPTNVEKMLVEMLKERTWLAGGGTSATNYQKRKSYTLSEISKMTTDEINKNWDAVQEVLKESRK